MTETVLRPVYANNPAVQPPQLIMASLASLRADLDELKRLKKAAQSKLHAELAIHRSVSKGNMVQSNGDAVGPELGESHSTYEEQPLPSDPMDWSAEQWARNDKFQMKPKNKPGYKDLSSLAHATYTKETRKRTVDLAQYEASKAENQNSGFSSENGFGEYKPSAENIDAVVKSIQEASDRKRKRRTEDVTDKQYVNEKNRQFNMKLDREYGAS